LKLQLSTLLYDIPLYSDSQQRGMFCAIIVTQDSEFVSLKRPCFSSAVQMFGKVTLYPVRRTYIKYMFCNFRQALVWKTNRMLFLASIIIVWCQVRSREVALQTPSFNKEPSPPECPKHCSTFCYMHVNPKLKWPALDWHG